MIYSMTAFARKQNQQVFGNLVCEIRSVNHRYLEVGTHLSDVLRAFEMAIRDRIRNTIKRGKVECSIRFQANNAANQDVPAINSNYAQELCKASELIASYLTAPASISASDILRFPGVLEAKEVDLEQLQAAVLKLVDETLAELLLCREREGHELNTLFLQRIELMEKELAKVKIHLPSILQEQRDRLFKRFSDAKVELDASRLEQEMVMFAQKVDVAEEVDRTMTHLNEVRRVLKQGGLVGRRLDFLLQELNREANTMGSKSVDPVLTHAAVELKVLIEQIREQVQNVE